MLRCTKQSPNSSLGIALLAQKLLFYVCLQLYHLWHRYKTTDAFLWDTASNKVTKDKGRVELVHPLRELWFFLMFESFGDEGLGKILLDRDKDWTENEWGKKMSKEKLLLKTNDKKVWLLERRQKTFTQYCCFKPRIMINIYCCCSSSLFTTVYTC